MAYRNLHRDVIPEGYYYRSVQCQSSIFVIEHDEHGVDHYNPRHLPTLAIGAEIHGHIVDIVTHPQPYAPSDGMSWVSMDHRGTVWSLRHWWRERSPLF